MGFDLTGFRAFNPLNSCGSKRKSGALHQIGFFMLLLEHSIGLTVGTTDYCRLLLHALKYSLTQTCMG
jgi:hypothetical protein